MRPTYLASLPHRRGRRLHTLRYRATYAVGIRAATLTARRGPAPLALRLIARWSSRARIVWSLDDGRGWVTDIGDELDDLATTTTLALRDRLAARITVDHRYTDQLDRLARMR
jgi:hypothetical protein